MTNAPKFNLIEKVALELAGVFYDTGRSQGLTSKHKSAKHYAAHNIEKFVPHALKHLMEILCNPSTPDAMKQEIYESIQERINDPQVQKFADSGALPKLDISKIIPVKDLPSVIVDTRKRSLI